MKQVSASRVGTERRLYPRYEVDIPVGILLGKEAETPRLDAVATNLSLGGIQLECQPEPVAILQRMPNQPAQCIIEFQLPDEDKVLHMSARLIIARRISQETFLIGWKYTKYHNGSKELLSNYLAGRQQAIWDETAQKKKSE